QPGMSLALGAIYSVFGPHIRIAQLLQTFGGALITLVIFDSARRAFDSTTGWVAALLWAIFPLPIFYEAQLLTHGLEAQVGALLIWLWILVATGFAEHARRVASPVVNEWLTASRKRKSVRAAIRLFVSYSLTEWRGKNISGQLYWLIALGLALGAAAVLRPTFLILAPLIALSLFFQTLRSSVTREAVTKSVATSVAILALITLIPIAPITWHNHKADGRFQLLNSSSGVTLYLGNNRDSTGLGEYSPAYWAAHKLTNGGKTTYEKQTLDDIRADPIRWAQLMARKTALYFGNAELPNNVDFYTEGAGISPMLSLLPLRFGAMMTLALVGTVFAFRRQNRGGALLLVVYTLTQSSIVIFYHVFSRFRAPIYPTIIILAAWAITETLRHVRARRWRRAAANFIAIAFSAAFIAALPNFAEWVMSRPTLAALPPKAITLNAPIGDSLTLLGYDPLPVAEPDAPIFITLYWQSNRPIVDDVYATVQLLTGDTQKIAQADQPIGTGSFPDFPTSLWPAGQIVWDRYLIQIPADAPTPLALSVLVAAYDRETGRRLGETNFGPLPLTRAQPLALPAGAIPIGAKVGAATLAAYQAEFDNQALSVTLYWQADDKMPEDGVVFVHLLDSAGDFVAGQDGKPSGGFYSTLAWQIGEGIVDEHRVALPAGLPSGDYQIAIGMYDTATQNRLQVITASGEIA
ncbi:MAG: glycosyltransferase family 39 protein, partial [Chloroflexota bacterium]